MKVNPLVLLPGTLFWVALIAAIVTKETWLTGLAIVLGISVAIGFGAVTLSNSVTQRKLKRRVWAEGSPTTAKVLTSRTNGALNNDPYVEMELNLAGRRVKVRQLISLIMLSKVQPGEEIAVKVDLLNPDVVVVDEALTPRGYS